jgi:hypothetical protein
MRKPVVPKFCRWIGVEESVELEYVNKYVSISLRQGLPKDRRTLQRPI